MDNRENKGDDALLGKVRGGLLTTKLALFKEQQARQAPPNRAQRRAAHKKKKGDPHASRKI